MIPPPLDRSCPASDDTGALVQLVDTADPAAVDWAEDVFSTYRDRSVPAGAVEGLPDWLPNPDS